MADIKISIFLATTPKFLSKRFSKDADGKLQKTPGGQLVKGVCRQATVEGPEALAALISGLGTNEALAFGVAHETAGGEQRIYSRNAAPNAEALTRTKARFDWPEGPGVMLLDNDTDPRPGATQLNTNGFLFALGEAAPALDDAPSVFAHSASSFICDAETGECLKGEGGHHAYVFVKDARDIPRAGKVLADRSWLAGYGYYIVSISGQRLERCLIDTLVWQPSRLCFSAGAACEPGLEQRRPAPVVDNANAPPLDTRVALPDLTAVEMTEVARLKAEARKAKKAAAPQQ